MLKNDKKNSIHLEYYDKDILCNSFFPMYVSIARKYKEKQWSEAY